MACDTKLAVGQTIRQRIQDIIKATKGLDAALANGTVKIMINSRGAVAFIGWPDFNRDGITDGCALRRILATGSPAAKAALARAEKHYGRQIDRRVMAQGVHSHDEGQTWHSHKVTS